MKNINIVHFLSTLAFLLGAQIVLATPHNIAPKAKVTASTELETHKASNVTDGIIRIENMGEWACKGKTMVWGYIEHPWIQLDWEQAQSINRVVLYDRPGLDVHTAGGTLLFSDGTEISVSAIPNDGSAKLVEFPAKTVKWVKFTSSDGIGKDLGLSEIEVFPAPEGYEDTLSWVNPFVESAKGRYFFFTPAARPMGMVSAAPITRNKNQYGGGYNYNSPDIIGFGQVHSWCLSGIQIMPTTGNIDPTQGDQGWKSYFSHDDEIAMPGYQRVFLEDHKIWVEMTSTERAAIYKFKYTQGNEQADVLTNLGGYLGNATMNNAKVSKVNNTEFEGSFDSSGRFWGGPEDVKIFFVVQFDKPYSKLNGWDDAKNMSDITKLDVAKRMSRQDSIVFPGVTQSYWNAPSAGVSAKYSVKAGDEIQMKIGMSYTSIENARNNLKVEASHWNFDAYKKESLKIWDDKLSRIKVKGGTNKQTTKFYTDLWHVLLGRHINNDVNGQYPDYTQGERYHNFTKAKLKVRQLPMENGKSKHNMYSFDALWLTQWNLNVLWGLAWPEIMDDFSASLVQYADNGGLLPRGAIAGGYSYIMTGTPASNLIASTMMKDLMTKVDPKHAFKVTKQNHLPGGMMGDNPEELQFYIDNGWCPGNAGKTLEWAFQDWSLAQMAKKLNKSRDYKTFMNRSNTWGRLFNDEIGLILPQDKDGNWMHKDPLNGKGWIESNAWQGTWQVSHDISQLSKLMGGNDKLTSTLNHAFEQAEPNDFVFGYSNGYISYANQPGCSNAHVFNHAGKPWLSQYWVRKVNEQAYGAITPDKGYGGHDEDQGQMSGVSVLMSMGLFSLRGNNSIEPRYELTSPVFDEIKIALDKRYYEGDEFTITTTNNSVENMYIQGASLNNNALNTYWFTHDDFQKGGHLKIDLGPKPNKSWGIE